MSREQGCVYRYLRACSVVQGRAGTGLGESLALLVGPPRPRSLLQVRHPKGPLGRLGERGCISLIRLRILDYLHFS
jgi:hypothetical protein